MKKNQETCDLKSIPSLEFLSKDNPCTPRGYFPLSTSFSSQDESRVTRGRLKDLFLVYLQLKTSFKIKGKYQGFHFFFLFIPSDSQWHHIPSWCGLRLGFGFGFTLLSSLSKGIVSKSKPLCFNFLNLETQMFMYYVNRC